GAIWHLQRDESWRNLHAANRGTDPKHFETGPALRVFCGGRRILLGGRQGATLQLPAGRAEVARGGCSDASSGGGIRGRATSVAAGRGLMEGSDMSLAGRVLIPSTTSSK